MSRRRCNGIKKSRISTRSTWTFFPFFSFFFQLLRTTHFFKFFFQFLGFFFVDVFAYSSRFVGILISINVKLSDSKYYFFFFVFHFSRELLVFLLFLKMGFIQVPLVCTQSYATNDTISDSLVLGPREPA